MADCIKFLISEELESRLIARVIVNEFDSPVGMIILWDYCPFRREGFLATWIGEENWGKGYNQIAKQLFLDEVFYTSYLDKIYLLIRNYNERSIGACRKLEYSEELNFVECLELREIYQDKISEDHLIFCIHRDLYVNKELLG